MKVTWGKTREEEERETHNTERNKDGEGKVKGTGMDPHSKENNESKTRRQAR